MRGAAGGVSGLGFGGLVRRGVRSAVQAGGNQAAPLPPLLARKLPRSPPPAPPAGKGKVVEEAAPAASRIPGDDGIALKTMDIFAGCGGLSEGMHQAGQWRQAVALSPSVRALLCCAVLCCAPMREPPLTVYMPPLPRADPRRRRHQQVGHRVRAPRGCRLRGGAAAPRVLLWRLKQRWRIACVHLLPPTPVLAPPLGAHSSPRPSTHRPPAGQQPRRRRILQQLQRAAARRHGQGRGGGRLRRLR